MIKSDAVAQLKQILGFRTDLVTQAPIALAQAQDKLEDEWPRPDIYPWFLRTELATTTTVANEPRVGIPSDYLSDDEESGLEIVNADNEIIPLEKNDFDLLRALYANTDATLPVAYSSDGLYYRLFPAPDAIYTLYQKYYKKDTAFSSLDDSAENQWLKYAPWALIHRAAVILGIGGSNKNVSSSASLLGDCIAAIVTKSIWLQETNRPRAMGEVL